MGAEKGLLNQKCPNNQEILLIGHPGWGEGGWNMRVENRKLEGDLKVSDELTLNGSISSTATVTSGGYLIMNGIIGQDLILEKDSKVELFGTVTGNVYNRGGELAIHGTVEGALYKNAGLIMIHPESKIKGKVY